MTEKRVRRALSEWSGTVPVAGVKKLDGGQHSICVAVYEYDDDSSSTLLWLDDTGHTRGEAEALVEALTAAMLAMPVNVSARGE